MNRHQAKALHQLQAFRERRRETALCVAQGLLRTAELSARRACDAEAAFEGEWRARQADMVTALSGAPTTAARLMSYATQAQADLAIHHLLQNDTMKAAQDRCAAASRSENASRRHAKAARNTQAAENLLEREVLEVRKQEEAKFQDEVEELFLNGHGVGQRR